MRAKPARVAWVALAVALAAAIAVGGWWRRSGGWPGHEAEAPLELPLAADEEIAAAALARARARLSPPPAAPDGRLDDGPSGPRFWLCVYRALPGACAAGGPGPLGAEIDEAVLALATLAPLRPGDRLKLDWELARAPERWPAAARPHEAGTFGFAVGGAVILPSEVLELGVFSTADEDDPPTYDTDRLRGVLGRRGARVDEAFAFERIRTASWVESASGAGAVRTYRVHEWERVPMQPDEVLDRALWAADALARSVAADGRIRYRFDVSRAREQRGYNLLRHAGSTYALIEAWARADHPPWRAAAERALRYLLAHTRVDERTGPFGGGTTRWVEESSHVKLGGAGLALLALATWQQATGDATFATEAGELATYLLSQQQASGEFVYFASETPGGEPRDDTSAYYPGEAVVALATWHQVDPDPRWLEVAERGARWLIEVRDGGKPARSLSNDHWLAMGLRALHRQTGDPLYAAHALRIAEAVAAQGARHRGHDAYHRDYLGGYYEPPRSTPASTRGEALVAILELGVPAEREGEIRDLLLLTVQHLLQSQYVPDTVYWAPAPEAVVGHLAGGVVDPDLRNDFTQHALSALLGTERILRSEDRLPRLSAAEVSRRLVAVDSGPASL
jgi:hypothetical protein